MKELVKFLIARGREPSTYAGLGVILTVLHVQNVDSWVHDFSMLAVGGFGLLAMGLSETHALD